jgi:hypothetical protein
VSIIVKQIMAGARTTTATTPPNIKAIWSKSDDTKSTENVDRKFKMLMAEGNKDLINKLTAIDEAEITLEKAQTSALKSADFTAIATANLRLRAAQLEFNDAKAVFASTFGEEPNI